MKITAAPRSDQWNADDFVNGPRTFTISGVKVGAAEQKYDIELVEGEGRVWRPPVTVLRLLIAAWTDDSKQWVGKKVTLFRDETVKFGPETVGGIRVSHISGIDKPLVEPLSTSRGKRAVFRVQPFPSVGIEACTDQGQLRAMWATATDDERARIKRRVEQLQQPTPEEQP